MPPNAFVLEIPKRISPPEMRPKSFGTFPPEMRPKSLGAFEKRAPAILRGFAVSFDKFLP